MSLKGFFPYILLLMSSLTASGYTLVDSTKVYSRPGYRQIGSMGADNQASLDRFVNSVKDSKAYDDLSVRDTEDAHCKAVEPQIVAMKTMSDETYVADHPISPEVVEEIGVSEVEKVVQGDPVYRFVFKTNLLYDAALMPNIEFEWRINLYWSMVIEGNVAWWKNDPKHKYYQIAMVSPEVRYWFSPLTLWKGWYMGAFVGVGKYDLENGGIGYYGDGAIGGISVGYMWPIGKHLIIEAGLGAGYMFSRYKEYVPHDGHYLYQRTKNMGYFGPLKAKVSIGWRFYDNNKSKKVKQHYESK